MINVFGTVSEIVFHIRGQRTMMIISRNLVNGKCLSLTKAIPYLEQQTMCFRGQQWKESAWKLKALKSPLGPVRVHYIFVSDVVYFGMLNYPEYSSSLKVCLSNLNILVLVWSRGRLMVLHMTVLQKWPHFYTKHCQKEQQTSTQVFKYWYLTQFWMKELLFHWRE